LLPAASTPADRQAGADRAQPLDRRHARGHVGPDIDDDEVGRRLGAAVLDDADRDAASAQQPGDLAFEFFVVRDNLRAELGHVRGATSQPVCRGSQSHGTR
jgi:hypothetical protein